jgi:hypothetical protein
VQLLQEREGRGWEYNGQTTLKKEAVWLFRRAAGDQLGIPATHPGGWPPPAPSPLINRGR